jgi:hypothetical protein
MVSTMSRNPVRPSVTRRVPSNRDGKRVHRKSEEPDELQCLATWDSLDEFVEQDIRNIPLSARDRLVLACLTGTGGKQRIFQLAHDVSKYLDGRAGSKPDVQRTFLAVRSVIEDLAEQGLVTYSESRGTVQLA